MFKQDELINLNIHDQKDFLEERFAMLPFNTKVVDKFGGVPLYSSDSLKQKAIEAFEAQKILLPVLPAITKLIVEDKILPCFASKNLIRLLGHKMFSDPMSQAIRGFFTSKSNKIYLLLDNNTSFLFWVRDHALTYLTLHELQHYVAYNLKGSRFLSINENPLTTFYGTFFNNLFGIKMKTSHVQSYYYYLFKNIEKKGSFDPKIISGASEHLHSLISNYLNDKDTENSVKMISKTMNLYIHNTNAFIEEVRYGGPIRNVVLKLIKSYKSLGIGNPNTLAVQELLFPSEVIAIETQYRPNKNHFDSINEVV